MKTISKTKIKQVEYSPAVYESLKDYSLKTNLNSKLLKFSNDKKLVSLIEFETTKMLSLSSKSLFLKMGLCIECLLKSGSLKPSEVNLLNAFFEAYTNQHQGQAQSAFDAILSASNKSEVFQTIADHLKDANLFGSISNPGGDATAQGWFSDLLTGIGIAVGAVIGAITGGPLGSVIGAAAGGYIGRGLGKLISNDRDGFMLGPNGEDCTQPFLRI